MSERVPWVLPPWQAPFVLDESKTRWAGFRFQNLPDDQLRYYNALKAAHLTCHMIGEMVIAECKYADEDNGVVGDIVPLTEILARVCDLDRIRALPPEVGRLSGRLLSVRFTDKEVAELEDAIIKGRADSGVEVGSSVSTEHAADVHDSAAAPKGVTRTIREASN